MDKVKNSRNRLTPLLVAILICLVWILIFEIIYKVLHNDKLKNVKKLKLDDDLVQELYVGVSNDDILLYSTDNFKRETLPAKQIFRKATKTMTLEEVELNKGNFKISYEALDSAITTIYGPDFKYDLSDINGEVETYFEYEGSYLLFNVKYDKENKSYVGTYSKIEKKSDINVKRELVQAYKDKNINLKIGYVIYKQSDKYQICSDSTCSKIEKEVDSLDDYKYDKYIKVSLAKASDEVYYFSSSEK